MEKNLRKTIVIEHRLIQEDVGSGREIYQYIDGELLIGDQEMMRGCANGDVEDINILDYNGMVNVFAEINLVDIFSIMIKGILRMKGEKRGMYGEDNHFQEELIGGGLITVVVEIAFMLDQRRTRMLLVIINLEDRIHNQKMEHMEVNRGKNVQTKDKRVIQNQKED